MDLNGLDWSGLDWTWLGGIDLILGSKVTRISQDLTKYMNLILSTYVGHFGRVRSLPCVGGSDSGYRCGDPADLEL